MIVIENKELCTGCGACANKCTSDAIYMKADQEGFSYPSVIEEKCINCGACKAACPIERKKEGGNEKGYLHTYAAVNSNLDKRLASSSGGIFNLLAEYVLEREGVVFGAAFSSDFTRVQHTHVDTTANIAKLQGSKYVQSDIGLEFREVKESLERGRWVLFAGTSCQISGLKSYLNKEYEKLISVDFFCRGIPSPKVWKNYIQTYFGKEEIEAINFKDKVIGWKQFCVTIKTKKKKYIQNGFENPFMQGYFRGLYSRPSCHQCGHKGIERESDFTLADFWGIEHVFPEMDDNKGVSCILTHSTKAEKVLGELAEHLNYRETDVESALEKNPYACASDNLNMRRKKFWRWMEIVPFKIVIWRFCYPHTLKMKKRIKKMVGDERVKAIKQMVGRRT